MKIKDIILHLERIAPPALQESYDNSGLQVGHPEMEAEGVLVTLDVNEEVIQEAITLGYNFIIAHHPLIFTPLKKLTGATQIERCIRLAIRKDIAVYVMHTNLDNAAKGLNYHLARLLGVQNPVVLGAGKSALHKVTTFCPADFAEVVKEAMFTAGGGKAGNYDCCSFSAEGEGTFRPLEGATPYAGSLMELYKADEIRIEMVVPSYLVNGVVKAMLGSHPYEEVAYDVIPLLNADRHTGSGAYGALKEPMSPESFLEFVREKLGTSHLRYSGKQGAMIERIGVCGGSGSFLIAEAIAQGLDAFVTADLKYHQFMDSEGRILLIDAGHYETEIVMTVMISEEIRKKFPTFACQISRHCTNPIQHL